MEGETFQMVTQCSGTVNMTLSTDSHADETVRVDGNAWHTILQLLCSAPPRCAEHVLNKRLASCSCSAVEILVGGVPV
eukprot:SAG31_NODE_2861_length_4987_cov_105.905278_5_plen_78_part_00